jgi:PMC2NT (NUC016) domain
MLSIRRVLLGNFFRFDITTNNPCGDMFPRLHHWTHRLRQTLHISPTSIANPRPTPRAATMPDPPEPSAFDALHETITAALLATTRAATALCAEDLRFHRSLDGAVAAELDAQQRRILTLAERLLASAARGTGAAPPPRLADVDDLEAGWAAVVDVLDGELERADVALDGMAGVVRKGVEAPAGAPADEVC